MNFQSFPGGSKNRVNRAGENVRKGQITNDDLLVIERWRAAHRSVLNTFQAILRTRTKGTKISVAQRHKRKNTIFWKLTRIPGMQLSRMDDVAGCRLIFEKIEDLYDFRKKFHTARFKHRRRNDIDKYDYIKKPKQTGYRGIHDVYEYDVNSNCGRALKGLYIEIQYRTLVQHAWATAVELIGFITESQPKFRQGDTRYEEAMALASELLARAYEKSKGSFPGLSDREVLDKFLVIERELSLLNTLKGLNQARNEVTNKKNIILIFSSDENLEIKSYRDAPEALRYLFELEKQFPDKDIVLVKADTNEEIQLAFRSYFSDAKDFLDLIEGACTKLSGHVRCGSRD